MDSRVSTIFLNIVFHHLYSTILFIYTFYISFIFLTNLKHFLLFNIKEKCNKVLFEIFM